MTALLLGHDEAVAAWVASRLPHVGEAGFGPCRGIGLAVEGKLIGGVVYHAYLEKYRSVHLSMAATSPRWATPGTVRALLSYPFRDLGCVRVTMTIDRRNRRARRLAEGLGFKLEGVMRKGFGKADAVIYGMLSSEAERWLTSKH